MQAIQDYGVIKTSGPS